MYLGSLSNAADRSAAFAGRICGVWTGRANWLLRRLARSGDPTEAMRAGLITNGIVPPAAECSEALSRSAPSAPPVESGAALAWSS